MKTRAEWLVEAARWERLAGAAEAWDVEQPVRLLGKDGAWLAKQPEGREFKVQTAGHAAEAKKQALAALCDEAAEGAMEGARREAEAGHDEVEAIMQEVVEHGGNAGRAYTALYDILNKARGRGAGGGAKLASL